MKLNELRKLIKEELDNVMQEEKHEKSIRKELFMTNLYLDENSPWSSLITEIFSDIAEKTVRK